ncbi:MAG: outer membrane beta-barrel protein [Hyphomonadaceae bacterium]|nr:outer membrane beta-barrel protein [Hyphomonadaceae bacterium]
MKAGLFAGVALAALILMAPIGAGARAQTSEPLAQSATPQAFPIDRGRNESVADRDRPDFTAQGLRLGAFVVRPELGVDVASDSNIFYQPANEQDDLVTVLRPRVAAETDWSRHSLRGEIGLDDVRHQDSDSEDHTDVFAAGEARLDVRRGATLTVGGRQERLTERRSAPDSPGNAAKPLRLEVRSAFVAGVYEFNRARVGLRVDRENLNYKDAPLVGGGVADQDQRDHTTTTATARLEYGLSPDTALVAQVAANTREYDLKPPRAAFDRDSEGVSYLVGVNTDLTRLLRGEIIAGYLSQDYDDPALETAEGLALEARLEYFATPLTTVTVEARRRVDETLTTGASAFVSTDVEARVDHELRRNILLTAGLGTVNRAFQGIARDDDVVAGDFGARFLLNRRMELGARWRYERQTSSGPVSDPDYDVNRFTVSAVFRI